MFNVCYIIISTFVLNSPKYREQNIFNIENSPSIFKAVSFQDESFSTMDGYQSGIFLGCFVKSKFFTLKRLNKVPG